MDFIVSPIPRQNSEALPACPTPQDCGEALVRVDGALPRIAFAAYYRAAGLRGALCGCYVRAGLVPLLRRALSLLPQSYSLLVFDAYRPLAVQQALYDNLAAALRAEFPALSPAALAAKLDDFVALPHPNPARPAPHATGGALDVTLCRNGTPLAMGTEFDDFSPRATTAYYEDAQGEAHAHDAASEPAHNAKHRAANTASHAAGDNTALFRDNRRLLYHVMTAAGFVNYSAEWWHFAYGERLWARTFSETPRYGLYAGAPPE